MNLTEPQAGSDLGAVRSKALPQADGSYRISGSKIFISGGEHDLTDNIVHLVLARLHAPGKEAPAGSKGLSLFLAPKLLPDGTRNAIRCDGIEKKMGIKGSATCAMSFEGATGWLVGEPNRGVAAMFVMMNSARLHVAMQGLGQRVRRVSPDNLVGHSQSRSHASPPAHRRDQTASSNRRQVLELVAADDLAPPADSPESRDRVRSLLTFGMVRSARSHRAESDRYRCRSAGLRGACCSGQARTRRSARWSTPRGSISHRSQMHELSHGSSCADLHV
jgi:hypothetical protein